MAWDDQAATFYHGTDSLSATSIRLYGIDTSNFRRKSDFGAGFYVTTVVHQAEQWANRRCRKRAGTTAEVLKYELERSSIETLRHLAFVVDDNDYYDFIAYCRSGAANHGPNRPSQYEVVLGPVSLWPQKLVLASCDQLLFSNPNGLKGFDKPVRSLSPAGGQRFF